MTTPGHYRALKERAAIGATAPRNAIGLTGRERAAYLHGLLTNDIQAVRELLGLRKVSLLSLLLVPYKVSKIINVDWVLRALLLPGKYKKEIRAIDDPS